MRQNRHTFASLVRRPERSAAGSWGLPVQLLVVDAFALLWAGFELARLRWDGGAWGRAALLAVIAIAVEEGSARSALRHPGYRNDARRDITPVWAVAGAVALPTPQAVLMLAVVAGHAGLRCPAHADRRPDRAWLGGSAQLLGCLAAGSAVHAATPAWAGGPWAMAGAIAVLIAIVVQATVSRAVLAAAMGEVGRRGRLLLGKREDNLTELSLLSLGGLVAVTAVHQPWLGILMLAPMAGLRRGALVSDLETAATIDAKTGLLNASAWQQVAGRELAHAAGAGAPAAMLIIDIDRFKLVNDAYGHLFGDAVLRAVGHRLAAGVRESDTVGRFGGEEFVAVLPGADAHAALAVAERLRARIDELRLAGLAEAVHDGDTRSLSVSIGVACAPQNGAEVADLFLAADRALYRAKSAGRNQVALADRDAAQPVRALSVR